MSSSTHIFGKREGISNWIRKFSTEIFPEERRYRAVESIFGIFKWGTEQKLPPIDYVLLFKHVFAKCETCSIDEYENNIHAYFQVSLVHNKNRRIVVHETKNKQEALSMAQTLANGLHVNLKDASVNRK